MASTQKILKDAEDALVFHQSQSALLGGANPKLNSLLRGDQFNDSENLKHHLEEEK